MNKPNFTLASFCANLAYTDIAKKVKIILSLPNEYDENYYGLTERFVELKGGASSYNIAVYGQWYVISVDYLFKDSQDIEGMFEVIISENPSY